MSDVAQNTKCSMHNRVRGEKRAIAACLCARKLSESRDQPIMGWVTLPTVAAVLLATGRACDYCTSFRIIVVIRGVCTTMIFLNSGDNYKAQVAVPM